MSASAPALTSQQRTTGAAATTITTATLADDDAAIAPIAALASSTAAPPTSAIAALTSGGGIISSIVSTAQARAVFANQLLLQTDPLHRSCKAGNWLETRSLIEACGSTRQARYRYVNRRDTNGSSPIYHCVWYGYYRVLALLIHHGAEPNLQNNRRNTALHLVCEQMHWLCAGLLLQAGARIDILNAQGKTCLQVIPMIQGDHRQNEEAIEFEKYIQEQANVYAKERACKEEVFVDTKSVETTSSSTSTNTHPPIRHARTASNYNNSAAAAFSSSSPLPVTLSPPLVAIHENESVRRLCWSIYHLERGSLASAPKELDRGYSASSSAPVANPSSSSIETLESELSFDLLAPIRALEWQIAQQQQYNTVSNSAVPPTGSPTTIGQQFLNVPGHAPTNGATPTSPHHHGHFASFSSVASFTSSTAIPSATQPSQAFLHPSSRQHLIRALHKFHTLALKYPQSNLGPGVECTRTSGGAATIGPIAAPPTSPPSLSPSGLSHFLHYFCTHFTGLPLTWRKYFLSYLIRMSGDVNNAICLLTATREVKDGWVSSHLGEESVMQRLIDTVLDQMELQRGMSSQEEECSLLPASRRMQSVSVMGQPNLTNTTTGNFSTSNRSPPVVPTSASLHAIPPSPSAHLPPSSTSSSDSPPNPFIYPPLHTQSQAYILDYELISLVLELSATVLATVRMHEGEITMNMIGHHSNSDDKAEKELSQAVEHEERASNGCTKSYTIGGNGGFGSLAVISHPSLAVHASAVKEGAQDEVMEKRMIEAEKAIVAKVAKRIGYFNHAETSATPKFVDPTTPHHNQRISSTLTSPRSSKNPLRPRLLLTRAIVRLFEHSTQSNLLRLIHISLRAPIESHVHPFMSTRIMYLLREGFYAMSQYYPSVCDIFRTREIIQYAQKCCVNVQYLMKEPPSKQKVKKVKLFWKQALDAATSTSVYIPIAPTGGGLAAKMQMLKSRTQQEKSQQQQTQQPTPTSLYGAIVRENGGAHHQRHVSSATSAAAVSDITSAGVTSSTPHEKRFQDIVLAAKKNARTGSVTMDISAVREIKTIPEEVTASHSNTLAKVKSLKSLPSHSIHTDNTSLGPDTHRELQSILGSQGLDGQKTAGAMAKLRRMNEGEEVVRMEVDSDEENEEDGEDRRPGDGREDEKEEQKVSSQPIPIISMASILLPPKHILSLSDKQQQSPKSTFSPRSSTSSFSASISSAAGITSITALELSSSIVTSPVSTPRLLSRVTSLSIPPRGSIVRMPSHSPPRTPRVGSMMKGLVVPESSSLLHGAQSALSPPRLDRAPSSSASATPSSSTASSTAPTSRLLLPTESSRPRMKLSPKEQLLAQVESERREEERRVKEREEKEENQIVKIGADGIGGVISQPLSSRASALGITPLQLPTSSVSARSVSPAQASPAPQSSQSYLLSSSSPSFTSANSLLPDFWSVHTITQRMMLADSCMDYLLALILDSARRAKILEKRKKMEQTTTEREMASDRVRTEQEQEEYRRGLAPGTLLRQHQTRTSGGAGPIDVLHESTHHRTMRGANEVFGPPPLTNLCQMMMDGGIVDSLLMVLSPANQSLVCHAQMQRSDETNTEGVKLFNSTAESSSPTSSTDFFSSPPLNSDNINICVFQSLQCLSHLLRMDACLEIMYNSVNSLSLYLLLSSTRDILTASTIVYIMTHLMRKRRWNGRILALKGKEVDQDEKQTHSAGNGTNATTVTPIDPLPSSLPTTDPFHTLLDTSPHIPFEHLLMRWAREAVRLSLSCLALKPWSTLPASMLLKKVPSRPSELPMQMLVWTEEKDVTEEKQQSSTATGDQPTPAFSSDPISFLFSTVPTSHSWFARHYAPPTPEQRKMVQALMKKEEGKEEMLMLKEDVKQQLVDENVEMSVFLTHSPSDPAPLSPLPLDIDIPETFTASFIPIASFDSSPESQALATKIYQSSLAYKMGRTVGNTIPHPISSHCKIVPDESEASMLAIKQFLHILPSPADKMRTFNEVMRKREGDEDERSQMQHSASAQQLTNVRHQLKIAEPIQVLRIRTEEATSNQQSSASSSSPSFDSILIAESLMYRILHCLFGFTRFESDAYKILESGAIDFIAGLLNHPVYDISLHAFKLLTTLTTRFSEDYLVRLMEMLTRSHVSDVWLGCSCGRTEDGKEAGLPRAGLDAVVASCAEYLRVDATFQPVKQDGEILNGSHSTPTLTPTVRDQRSSLAFQLLVNLCQDPKGRGYASVQAHSIWYENLLSDVLSHPSLKDLEERQKRFQRVTTAVVNVNGFPFHMDDTSRSESMNDLFGMRANQREGIKQAASGGGSTTTNTSTARTTRFGKGSAKSKSPGSSRPESRLGHPDSDSRASLGSHSGSTPNSSTPLHSRRPSVLVRSSTPTAMVATSSSVASLIATRDHSTASRSRSLRPTSATPSESRVFVSGGKSLSGSHATPLRRYAVAPDRLKIIPVAPFDGHWNSHGGIPFDRYHTGAEGLPTYSHVDTVTGEKLPTSEGYDWELPEASAPGSTELFDLCASAQLSTQSVSLRVCELRSCGAVEHAANTFILCPRCQRVAYCSHAHRTLAYQSWHSRVCSVTKQKRKGQQQQQHQEVTQQTLKYPVRQLRRLTSGLPHTIRQELLRTSVE